MILVTVILIGSYIYIEKFTGYIDKDKWQNLLSIGSFALVILSGFYTAIRMDRAEETRKNKRYGVKKIMKNKTNCVEKITQDKTDCV